MGFVGMACAGVGGEQPSSSNAIMGDYSFNCENQARLGSGELALPHSVNFISG